MRLILQHEHEHAVHLEAIVSVAEKIGCAARTLNKRLKKAGVAAGKRTSAATGLKPPER